MDRRQFVKLCTAAAAALAVEPHLLAQAGVAKSYGRAKLVDKDGKPITAASLEKDKNYIFHYPFVGTPCLLINLGRPVKAATLKTAQGESYTWKGGVGPDHSVVAFSAICSHQLVHPSAKMALISYQS
ncbi:MAG: twin-arginine translocation signal domain-containing protein, partial [Gammaproteobacteria bacterium]